jgi:hypothetical protein
MITACRIFFLCFFIMKHFMLLLYSRTMRALATKV